MWRNMLWFMLGAVTGVIVFCCLKNPAVVSEETNEINYYPGTKPVAPLNTPDSAPIPADIQFEPAPLKKKRRPHDD